ncbi:MAG: hypothetical protein VB036_13025 [Propionicimonas sp.]|nr:hypothetical protein [Propionicimonas sp.]
MTERVFFKPREGWVGDVTPFFYEGVFHLFYLKEWRDLPYDSSAELAHAPDSRLAFHHLTTRDFLVYQDHGLAVPNGGEEDPDWSLGTGSIIERDGTFHFFYTGMNPRREWPQVQCVATSTDLYRWRKDAGFELRPPTGWEPQDFRDPYVHAHPAGGYRMLLAGRRGAAPWHRRGSTLVARSDDLRTWIVEGDLYAPETYYMHECPDLFEEDGRWYLVFSEFSRTMQTRYRMATSPDGPFDTPEIDVFDTRACYAAKTVSDGVNRYLIGWIPSRDERGEWLWGGQLTVLLLKPDESGELRPFPVPGVAAAAGTLREARATAVRGVWRTDGRPDPGSGADGASSPDEPGWRLLDLGEVPSRWSVELTVEIGGVGGVVVDRGGRGIEVRIDSHEMVIDTYPRRGERLALARARLAEPDPLHTLTVVAEDGVLQVVSHGRAALTTRVEPSAHSRVGVWAESGPIEMMKAAMWT